MGVSVDLQEMWTWATNLELVLLSLGGRGRVEKVNGENLLEKCQQILWRQVTRKLKLCEMFEGHFAFDDECANVVCLSPTSARKTMRE